MPKKYDDIEAISAKESVASWLKSLREGTSRKNAKYGLTRFQRWRKSKGLQSDPDLLIKECLDGTNRTLLDHTKLLIEWCHGDDLASAAPATIFRSCGIVRSFYAHHMVALPSARLRIPRQVGAEVKTEMTADEYLRVFRRAIELKPSYATAHQWFAGMVLEPEPRWDEALEHLEKAVQLDPFPPRINQNHAYYYFRRKDFGKARAFQAAH